MRIKFTLRIFKELINTNYQYHTVKINFFVIDKNIFVYLDYCQIILLIIVLLKKEYHANEIVFIKTYCSLELFIPNLNK